MDPRRLLTYLAATAGLLVLGACGGGGSSSSDPGVTLVPPSSSLVRVSAASPYGAGCGGAGAGSVSYEDAEVEPYVAVNPNNPSNLIGVWQQDRWSDGGAHGLVAGSSLDGGKTWKRHTLPFSVCAGGNQSNGGDFARASDPWVTFSPDGTAYAIAISFTGDTLAPGSDGGVLVSRSTNGGTSWSHATTLIRDGANAFNDKESITADPADSHFVYAVWDRLTVDDHGAAMFARTVDGGATWEAAKAIYDPGTDNQTIGNEIVVMPDGTLIDLFEELDGTASASTATATIRVIRSSDHGDTWSAPITVADDLSVGTVDPATGTPLRTGAGLPQIAAGPGTLAAIVWQDGRFSNGARDDVAFSRSSDNGLHWSTPKEINSVHSTQAFTPSIAILGNGTFGVTYFDFRNDTPAASLPTDYWFISSSDGTHWSEQHVSGPFDMTSAPDAEGLFIGDYEALGTVGNAFVPFFVQTNNAATDNRTDDYFLPATAKLLTVSRTVTHVSREIGITAPEPDAAFRQRVHDNLMRLMSNENPNWMRIRAQRMQRAAPP